VGIWVFPLNIGKLFNSNLLNENNYQIVSNYSTAVEHFSVKVFTEENTTVLAGRRVKVGEGWEGGKGGRGGKGIVVSNR
jgi:hypothetical protein